MSEAFTFSAEFVPNESRVVNFAGTCSVSKTTLTVYKTPIRRSEEPLMVGLCSLALVRFYSHKQHITLTTGHHASHLFDRAAKSISGRNTKADNGSGAGDIDNPSTWQSISITLRSTAECEDVVAGLRARHVTESHSLPFPMTSESNTDATPVSLNLVDRNNNNNNNNNNDNNVFSSHGSGSVLKPMSSHISERPDREESDSRVNTNRQTTPKRSTTNGYHDDDDTVANSSHRRPMRRDYGVASTVDMSTPRSSRLPSRRGSESLAYSQSARSVDSGHSSRLPSRRGDEGTNMSIRSSAHQRIAPHRTTEDPLKTPERTHSKQHQQRRGEVTPSSFSETPRSNASASRRQPQQQPRYSTVEHAYKVSPRRAARGPPEDSAVRGSRASPKRRDSPSSRQHQRPLTAGSYSMEDYTYSNTITPRSTTLSRGVVKDEQDMLMRAFQKLQHHRLHFMQYLHKEMVHQAFLVEEAKVKAVAKATRTASRRASSAHVKSPHRSSSAAGLTSAEESKTLKEIQARLASVEVLHKEAAKERDDAARLRREFEWKNDELNARLNQQGIHLASRDASEFNSSVITPQRASAYFSQNNNNRHNNNNGSVPRSVSNQYALVAVPDMPAAQRDAASPYFAVPPEDADMGIAIVDRYIFGDEWDRLYPAQETNVRFNAQMDVCLALKLPRRLVTITNLVVDKPGLRVTAEIRFDRAVMERDVVERRMGGCPFRFLQRMYDLRDIYGQDQDSTAAKPAAVTAGRRGSSMGTDGAMRTITAGPQRSKGRRPSSSSAGTPSRRYSRGSGSRHQHEQPYGHFSRYPGDEDGEDDDVNSVSGDIDARRDQLHQRTEDRVKDAERRMSKKRKRLADDVRREIREHLVHVVEEEDYARERVELGEARQRKDLARDANRNAKETLTTSISNLEEDEAIDRATTEVGAARQMQLLLGAHRRAMTFFQLRDSEAQRRNTIAETERLARADLNDAMNPRAAGERLASAERADARRQRRAQRSEARDRARERAAAKAAEVALENIQVQEIAGRAMIRSDAMNAWLDVLCRCAPPNASQLRGPGRRGPSSTRGGVRDPATFRQMVSAIVNDEAEERAVIAQEESRRRFLYRREGIVVREHITRDEIELGELDGRGAILNEMVRQNRAHLERRMNAREQANNLLNEEDFYRKTIVSDEQDEFEVIAELFTAAMKALLLHMAEEPLAEDDDLPRYRRPGTQRNAKPFHYMTFEPEDMDFPPSAVLAVEGVLGCAINKNLEVVSISSPLPKVEEEDLQFQAGDMILDVAGHSLHSLSHLREVLSNRTMQIQTEAFEEFPDVPENQLTVSPALQKYIEVLCEHHNFLVQVLRGCDIYQIIVKS